MKKKHLFVISILLLAATLPTQAQPSTVKDVARSLFTLTTYRADGTILAAAQGVFTGSDGEAVTLWTPFVGAEKAVVTDASGRVMSVETIMGVSELYDVCKIRIAGKTQPLSVAAYTAAQGEECWVVNGDASKAANVKVTAQKVETFMNDRAFYVLGGANTTAVSNGAVVINKKGQPIGIVQISANNNEIHATDIAFAHSLQLEPMATSNALYRRTGVRLEMPADREQALIMLMMSRERDDSLRTAQYIDDYIRLFPTAIDGYSARAVNYITGYNFAAADADLTTAVTKAADKAEAHAEYARLIHLKTTYYPTPDYAPWTLDRALEEITTAQKINAKPAYKHLEAQIIYSKGDYDKAYNMFIQLLDAGVSREELFYEAALCRLLSDAPRSEVIMLLDSAVEASRKPLTNLAAPYILARAQVHDAMGEYRAAVQDYNRYDTLMAGRCTPDFYYTRYLCEVNAKQYQQALRDITYAVLLEPSNAIYAAELASLQLRVGRYDEAIVSAGVCITIAPEGTDAYIIKGLAHAKKGDINLAIECFQQAKDLGDTRAQQYLDIYAK